MIRSNNDQPFKILRYGKPHGKKLNFAIGINDGECLVDIKFFPSTILFCAGYDGVPMYIFTVGKKNEERNFLPLNWVIEGWNGPSDIVSLLKAKYDYFLQNWEQIVKNEQGQME